MTKQEAYKELYEANKKAIKGSNYRCGLTDEQTKSEIGCGDYFFESPDGQNLKLFYALKDLGWRGEYKAPYLWKLTKQDIAIMYSEGDIYITNNTKLKTN